MELARKKKARSRSSHRGHGVPSLSKRAPLLSDSYLQIAAFHADKETQEHNQSQPSDPEIAANGGLRFKPGSAIEPMIPPVRDFNPLTLCLFDK